METSDKDSGLGGNQSYNLQETECPGSSCKWHSILVLLHWIFFFFFTLKEFLEDLHTLLEIKKKKEG